MCVRCQWHLPRRRLAAQADTPTSARTPRPLANQSWPGDDGAGNGNGDSAGDADGAEVAVSGPVGCFLFSVFRWRTVDCQLACHFTVMQGMADGWVVLVVGGYTAGFPLHFRSLFNVIAVCCCGGSFNDA